MKQWLLACLLSVGLWGCTSPDAALNELRVGVIAGPESELMNVAKGVALAQSGLKLNIMTFSDYMLPNTALMDGSLDVNVFQHQVYLDNYLKAHPNADLVSVAKTFIYPMGIYSSQYTLDTLPMEAKVAIPNDPSNEARALLLLEKAGLIKLSHRDANRVTLVDVVENPRHLKIMTMNAAQLPRVLPDVGLAVINTNYGLLAGLKPSEDALVLEDQDSPYANIVVVRAGFAKDPRVSQLVEALHSPAVSAKAEALFKGQAIPAWQKKDKK